jgi:sugar phosphate isomerase/epimerase
MEAAAVIGASSVGWFELSLDRALARMAALVPLVEVYSAYGHSLLTRANRRAAVAAGVPVTVHGPWVGLDLGDPDEAARRKAVTVHRRQLEAAALAGARVYVVHPDGGPSTAAVDDAGRRALRRSLGALRRAQDECGVLVAVENMPTTDPTRFGGAGFDLGGLGFALDVGHAAVAGTLDDLLGQTAAPLLHVHLHDNLGPGPLGPGERPGPERDMHLPLGRGYVDPEPVLQAAARAGAGVILELGDEAAVVESLACLRARGLTA